MRQTFQQFVSTKCAEWERKFSLQYQCKLSREKEILLQELT